MNMLKGLTFAAVPRENSLTPQQKRRNKLIAHLREQLAMAEAEIDGRIHVVKKRRWECGSAWKKDPFSGVIGVEQGPLIPMV